jgi:hypothetical protein
MANGPLIKLRDARAKDVCARCTLPATATRLLEDDMTPTEFIQALMTAKQYVAGIDFIAHALPTRESVWWSCLTIQHAFGSTLAGKEREAVYAAVQWVLKPTEDNRTLARAPAEAAGAGTAGGAAATAAAIAGSSSSFTSAKAVANAVKLASTKSDPARIADTQRIFIGLALGIAEGNYM